ncbi:sigma factor-like helix-turn-helix DNA-binding protein [Microbacterium sp.]|uniref:sigma-70 region 4 domain-containing protein n=1 Tax=Microbacterium sp. TaxID=51671 RepID=UPI0039E5FB4C
MQEHVPDRDDGRDLVRMEVSRLPGRQREIVILVHGDRFPLVDAAGYFGIRPTTARTRYQRARDVPDCGTVSGVASSAVGN